MKKKRFLAIVLTVFMGCSGVLTGCGENSGQPEKQAETTDAQNTFYVDGKSISKKVVLLDFEEYNPDFQLIRVDKTFGKISQNSDEKYVKNGKYSAKVQPLGGCSSNSEATFFYPLSSNTVGFNYADIRNWECLSVWVYNAQDVKKVMKVALVGEVVKSSPMLSGEMTYTLEPGWNDITYFPNPETINIAYDAQNVKGINFTFENAGSRELADAPVYYFDDLTLYLNTEYNEVEDVMTFDRDEENGVYEIIGFDKEYQAEAFNFQISNPDAMPDAEVVVAADEGITATEGKMVLKLTLHPGNKDAQSWPKIVFPEKLMQQCGFMNIPKEERNNYRFCFDFYAKDIAKGFVPIFFSSGAPSSSEFKPVASISTVVGEWVTASFDFKEYKDTLIESPGPFYLAWGEYKEELGDIVMYMDNFRYEKIGTETATVSEILADYHTENASPIGGSGLVYEYVKEFAGEKGCYKITSKTTSWPQMEFIAKNTIRSYKEAEYKYVVFRMYFPTDGITWESLTYGAPNGIKGTMGKVVKGKWVDYYVSTEALFANWTDNGFINEARLYSDYSRDAAGNEAKGAVAYISEIRVEK